jgi:hypothetical protein
MLFTVVEEIVVIINEPQTAVETSDKPCSTFADKRSYRRLHFVAWQAVDRGKLEKHWFGGVSDRPYTADPHIFELLLANNRDTWEYEQVPTYEGLPCDHILEARSSYCIFPDSWTGYYRLRVFSSIPGRQLMLFAGN